MAELNKPLESYDSKSFSWDSRSWTDRGENRQADRKASLDDVTTYIYQSLVDYQGKWAHSDINEWTIRMPYARYLAVGDPVVNVDTGEVYSINNIVDPKNNVIRLGGSRAPELAQRLKLDSSNMVNFISSGPQKHIEPVDWRDTITYRVKKRQPGTIDSHPFGARKEIKPRLRQTIPDPDYPDYHIEIYAQWFDNLIQFDCWATTNFGADTLIEWFEDFMFKYTWVFKKNGVQEMLYTGRHTDETVTKWRDDIVNRSVDYYFRTEKIVPLRLHDLTRIDILAGLEDTIEAPGETIKAKGSTSIFQSYLSRLFHSDLADMPDYGGTNSDHDARYYTKAEIDASGFAGEFEYDRDGYFSDRFNESITASTPTEALDAIFQFSSISPSVVFSLAPSATREKGDTLSSITLNANITRGENPRANISSVVFRRGGVDIHEVPEPTPEGGMESFLEETPISDTTSFSVYVEDVEERSVSSSRSLTFLYPILYLVGSVGLSTSDIYNNASKILSSSRGRTLEFTTSNQVPYYCIPHSLGALNSIRDQNGYEVISSWTLRSENITGLDGQAVLYRIYEFNNLTTTTQSYTFS